VELHLKLETSVDLDRVPLAFGDEAPNWLGQPTGRDEGGLERHLCDLELLVRPGTRAMFRKSAIVSVGVPRWRLDSWVVPIEWRAASLAPLFPVFVGRLVIAADRILLDGHYAPPFGVVGYMLDRAVLSTVARATGRWFLNKVASVIG
jgi:hypothetical protein